MNLEDLEKLAELKKKGIITQEEFDAQKQAFLKGIGATSQNQKSGWEYYKLCWRKYVQFSGRASRSEYWYFFLFNFLIGFIIGFISGFLGFFSPYLALPFDMCSWIYTIAAILPSWAVFVRRYHDIGKSAWFAFIPLFIMLGLAVLSIMGLVIDYATYTTPNDYSTASNDYNTALLAVSSSFSTARAWTFIFGGIAIIVTYIVWYIVFPCLPSQQGSNKYGPQP